MAETEPRIDDFDLYRTAMAFAETYGRLSVWWERDGEAVCQWLGIEPHDLGFSLTALERVMEEVIGRAREGVRDGAPARL